MTMITRDFDRLGNIQSALDLLRYFNQYVLFPVNESVFDNPELEEYFESPLDSPIERNIEKIVCVAGIKAVYGSPNIPAFNKKMAAMNTARDLREAMRYAKLEYHAKKKGLTHIEYGKRKKGISIVRRIMKIRMAETLVKNTAITTIATVVAGPVGAVATVGGRLIYKFLPDKVKKVIQENAKDIQEKAINVLVNTVDYIKSTSVGKSVQKVIDVVKPTVLKTVDVVKKNYNKVKDFAKSFWPF